MKDLSEVLKTALEIEKKGQEFYLEASRRVSDVVISSILISLMHDEEAHARTIEQYYGALQRAQNWPPPEESPLISSQERIAKVVAESGNIGPDATFQNIYESARQLELRSRDFYRAERENADDPRVAKLLDFLTNMEAIHIEMLDSLLESSRPV